MRLLATAALTATLAVVLGAESASACQTCHRTPCVMPSAPPYQCVTEMVPYTVMKTRMRVEYQEVTHTVMVREPQTTWQECQRVVCRPKIDVTYVQRRSVVCKPVYETDYVTQCVTVCKPVTTVKQVPGVCLQATTQLVSVPTRGHCGLCGRSASVCGCRTAVRTCYTQVPTVRNVVETHMVRDVETRQVPVTRCRMVQEERVDNVPVTHCSMVQEVVTERIPHTTFVCVPKQVTRRIPHPVCETVPVTCYRPVTRMVPTQTCAAPMAMPVAGPSIPSGQAMPTSQAVMGSLPAPQK